MSATASGRYIDSNLLAKNFLLLNSKDGNARIIHIQNMKNRTVIIAYQIIKPNTKNIILIRFVRLSCRAIKY